MSDIQVIAVSRRSERRRFFRLPWKLYRDDPYWIPPLRQHQLEMLNFKPHPFYEDAVIQTFLASRDGEDCGRVAAILNHAHNRRHREQRGFFGYFESIDDQAVATALMDAVKLWFDERGIRDLRGPMNPSMNYEIGLLIDGFDSSPTFMMTYNPPCYEKLIEGCGFRKCQDLYAFWGHVDMLKTLDEKVAFIAQEAQSRFGVSLRPLDRRRFREEVRTFLRIYNESLGGTWGFAPMSEREVDHMSKSLQHLIVPEMTSVAEVDGKTVAVAFGLLDYNPRIKQIDGRLFPFGFLKLLRNRRQIKRIRIISTNVVPEYQRWGLGLVILNRLVPEVYAWGIEEAEFSWVLESNHLSFKTLKRGGAKITKKYRLYDYGPNAEWPDSSADAGDSHNNSTESPTG